MNDTYSESKPERIKSERKRLGLTQAQAAERCGIRRQQWIRYEKGTSDFDGETLRKFGDAGASISYILTGEKSDVRLIGQFENRVNDDAKKLIELFNSMTPEKQALLMQNARVFANEPITDKKSKSVTNINPNNSDNKGYINQGNHDGDLSFGK